MSVDKVNTGSAHTYPVEFLNPLNASGLPLACLTLKPGCHHTVAQKTVPMFSHCVMFNL